MPLGETVVLVHGLWLHSLAMTYLKHAIERRGYSVLNYSYPTVRLDLTSNARRLVQFCERAGGDKLHLLGQSMGGLVVLEAARMLPRERLGRTVLVGTPYGDCYSGRKVQRLPGGRVVLGRCMGQWLSAARTTNPVDLDVGVIAGVGSLGLGRIFAPSLPKPNDGVVSVDETHVPGMRDHVVLRASHTFMLVSREVVHQTCAYLAQGKFDHARAAVVSVNS